MKKLILSITLASLAATSFATLDGNGFYRVRNYGSSRWADMVDNAASADFLAGTADLHSLQLTSNTAEILTDPGSIVLLTNESGNMWSVAAQGTSLGNLVDEVIYIQQDGTTSTGETLYRIYAKRSGVTKYIGDANVSDSEIGKASINVSSKTFPNYNKWEMIPVNVNSDNYFGVVPSVNADGKGYTSLYTSFAYKPYSSGVKAYYISRVYGGYAEMIEITGDVPQGSPVILQTAGTSSADNKMSLTQSQVSPLTSNALNGVYFNYKSSTRTNRVAYNPSTMRVLGVCSDGSLGFVKADIESIPANTAYLKVKSGAPDEIKCVDTNTFLAGVDTVIVDETSLQYDGYKVSTGAASEISVLNLDGHTVLKVYGDSIDVSALPKGVYIVVANGKSLKIVR